MNLSHILILFGFQISQLGLCHASEKIEDKSKREQVSSSLFSSNKIAIEISSGKTKTTTFAITSNNETLANKIKKKLEFTRRFKHIVSEISAAKMQAAGIDMFIKISLIEEKINVEIYDVLQKKLLKSITITGDISQEYTLNEIANQVYKHWINEPGIFNTAIIAISDIGNDLSTLVQAKYGNTKTTCISPPIAYLNSIIKANACIYITKFCTKKRGFGIFSYDWHTKHFYRILGITNGSVFAPALFNGKLYISASSKGTTGIYSLPHLGEYKQFADFAQFEKDPNTKKIAKFPNKIATSINVNNKMTIFCSNSQGAPAIFSSNNTQLSSSSGAYYDPCLFEDQKIAAIKSQNGQFHLVIIDLVTKTERTLLSKYFISKPSWSPCGNWIAVSVREKGENDYIILLHKSGKYQRVIAGETPLKNPIWIIKE